MPVKKRGKRKSWDEYFLSIARLVAERSTCLRRKVGAVLVREKRILCTGYNGAPHGLPHCAEVGCLREKLHIPAGERIEICRGIHAEQNTLVQAATFGIPVYGATLYCTHAPCVTCAKMLINAGVREFVIADNYPDEFARQLLNSARVKVRLVKLPVEE
ncbi:MAG: deoxycytidylate deaminase [candidate division WOR-3 bacterium]|jgi:dCMP deaminase